MTKKFYGSYAPFQNESFLKVYAHPKSHEIVDVNGVKVLMSKSRWLGFTQGFVGAPERVAPSSQWLSSLAGLNCGSLYVHTTERLHEWDHFLISAEDNCNLYFDLSEDIDQIYNNFRRSCRKSIRSAINNKIYVRESKEQHDLEKFYSILKVLAADGKHFPILDIRTMQKLLDQQFAMLLLSCHENNIIGGMFCLIDKDMFGWMGAFDDQYRQFSPGNLIMYEAIKWAKNKRLNFFDLGQQSVSDDKGKIFFKRSFRPKEQPAYFYHVRLSGWKSWLLNLKDKT